MLHIKLSYEKICMSAVFYDTASVVTLILVIFKVYTDRLGPVVVFGWMKEGKKC